MPRGRPRKIQIQEEVVEVEPITTTPIQTSEPKRGRGRPPKKEEPINNSNNTVESTVKAIAEQQTKVLNDSKLCIIVDMQNDFITGSLANKNAEKIVAPMCNFIKKYDGHILFTQDTHHEDYLNSSEGKKLPIIHCIDGTEGWEIHKKLRDTIKKENRNLSTAIKFYFGVGETFMNRINNEMKVAPKVIDIMGVCTDICVVSVALELKTLFPDSEINVYADLCAGSTVKKHQAALDVMESCQINIIRE